MRLDKYICEATGCTRTEAKAAIRRSWVEVNGEILRSAAAQVAEDADVLLRDQSIALPQPIYIMLNKPAGLVCATEDDMNPTVMSLLPLDIARRAHIVGRLDKDTTGLLLITDDGDWTHAITAPRKHCAKTYVAHLADELSLEALRLLEAGVELRNESQKTLPAHVRRLADDRVEITIEEGRYHQIKRMFAAVGNRVLGLHRRSIGGVELPDDLPEGGWRSLSEIERQAVFESESVVQKLV